MALIKCPECGAEMSDMANACPKCAFPNKPDNIQKIEQKNDNYIPFIIVSTLVFIIVAFWWFEIRPTQIRQQCYSDSESSKNKLTSYDDCLMKNGITRSIFSN